LIEDIDAVFSKRYKYHDVEEEGVTLQGLLKVLDGHTAQEGQLIFLTTNHKDKLAPEILKPGRVDFYLHLGYATSNQIYNYFLKFYPGHLDLASAFADCVEPDKYPISLLQ
jgi:chaperone BCS1